MLILQGFSAFWVVYRGVSFGDSFAACVTKLAPNDKWKSWRDVHKKLTYLRIARIKTYAIMNAKYSIEMLYVMYRLPSGLNSV